LSVANSRPKADTKFEFALDEETDEIYLVDEVLTYVFRSLHNKQFTWS